MRQITSDHDELFESRGHGQFSYSANSSCGFGRRPTSETWREINVLMLYLLAEHMVVANTKEINSCRSRTPPLSLNRCNNVCRD